MKIVRSGARTPIAVTLLLILGAPATWGCSDDPTAQTTTGAEATSGAGGDTGKDLEPEPPECSSPSGYQLCGGPNHCSYDESVCEACFTPSADWEAQGTLTICRNDALRAYRDAIPMWALECGSCADGAVCIDFTATGAFFGCAPFELGVLYAQNGGADRVRYADGGLWTGEPLPEPTDCPDIPGVPLCGGACGDCPEPYICTGRSPLHPFGRCIGDFETYERCATADDCYGAEVGCLQWKVQPEVQGKGFKPGLCYVNQTCQEMAALIPGGGVCLVK